MRNRRSIREAMGSSRVRPNVSTNRACLLRRRVGSEVVSERLELIRQVEVDDTRADPGRGADEVDVFDLIESGEHDQQTGID